MTEELHASAAPPSREPSHVTTPNEDAASATTPIARLIAQRGQEVEPVTPPPPPPLFTDFAKSYKKPGTLLVLMGVVLPALSLGLEAIGHLCAGAFFDPLPTGWHVLLVGSVPLASALLAYELRQDDFEYRWYLGLANGAAIGVAAFYTVLFLPLLPLAFFALIFLGLGLLPMTPLLALIATVAYARHLRQRVRAEAALLDAPRPRLRGLAWGVSLALLALVVAELPTTVARVGLHMAASDDLQTSLRGIRWLRARGSEAALLRACYWRAAEPTDLVGFVYNLIYPVTTEQARGIYYRVTGQPFDAAAAPRSVTAGLDDVVIKNNLDQTGELVSRPAQGLALANSRMDGSLDADAALGYLEWTMVFSNAAGWQQEAVSQIVLPPGGVVSRLTLWVNGEEREAAFAERARVQAAYDAVVRTRRDPVLVTSSGVDRVSVRCFPVPPNGEMKIRLGITAPLHLESGERAWLRLPRFLERNFEVAAKVEHAVWVEAKRPVAASLATLQPENPRAELYAVRGGLPHVELAKHNPAISAQRTTGVTQVWTPDPTNQAESISQTFATKEHTTARRVVMVIDGSRGMREFAPALAEALTKLPEQAEFAVLIAADEVTELASLQPASADSTSTTAARLKQFAFQGGHDNLPALVRAWEIAAQRPEGLIVWLHEPQPIAPRGVEELRQRWERRPGQPVLLDLQTRNGANLIAEKLDGISAVATVLRLGTPAQDLERLFANWRVGAEQITTSRTKILRRAQNNQANAKETSAHLARLWAHDEVIKLLSIGEHGAAERATKLAASYQLVTPVTGAVVLETKEQYERAGLQPVERSTVPTIPEPEEWLLLIVVALILTWTLYRRRPVWKAS